MSLASPVNRGAQLNTNPLTKSRLAEITGLKFSHVKSPAQVTGLVKKPLYKLQYQFELVFFGQIVLS
jgi:hypothetical protein